jgi:hypothetical protein
MRPTRITATLGAVALGGVLVASTTSVGASASVDHQRPAIARVTVHDHFVAPAPHRLRPHSNLRMGLHCDSADMSI